MESKIEFTKADESSFDGTAYDRYSADEVAFVSPNDAKPNVSRSLCLPFRNIDDLVRKVEKIKAAHLVQQQTFRQSLNEAGIAYQEIDEFGVFVDIGGLSKEQIEVIKANDSSFIKDVYAQCGVSEN